MTSDEPTKPGLFRGGEQRRPVRATAGKPTVVTSVTRMGAVRSGPLAGIRIVELAGIGPVPFAGMLLADMGAEILLVRPPAERDAQMPLEAEHDPLFRGRARLMLDL